MSASRHNRRSARPLEDLPSLFGPEADDAAFEVTNAVADDTSATATDVDDAFTVAEEYTRPLDRLRFISFGSGSSGNCSYIGTPEAGVLIDAGVDNNFVTRELQRNGIDISTVKGIILTHDHGDHVRYAYALLRRNRGMLLYCTPRILEGILRRHNTSRRIKEYHSPIFKEHEYLIGSMRITPFETSHDGTDNCGFHITHRDTTFVVATDMGYVTERADHYIRLANVLMIESNYDEQMLTTGRYAEYLKSRIRSNTGHMDNADTARYLTEIYTPKLTHIFLCHLSEDNNTPETAMATALNALRTISVRPASSAVNIAPGTVYIMPLPRFTTTDLFAF